MAITGFYESSLGTSEVFNDFNTAAEGKITERAVNAIKNSKYLKNEDIEAAYISVKQITDTLTREALKAFDDERIVLVYNDLPKEIQVTQSLPFITFKNAKTGKYVTYIFIYKYITISRDGIMNLQAPILRDLLTGALIANSLKSNYSILASNQYLQKVLMEVYNKFVTRVLNREFSIAADKTVFDVVQYWINKFFLTRILGSNDTPENIETLSKSHFKFIDDMKYSEIKMQYETSNPQKFSDLLEIVKTASPRMKTLNKATFIGNWINYYYIPSMLAIDNIEYLIFMMIALLNGNNIISISASDIVKEAKNIKSFRSELLKLI